MVMIGLVGGTTAFVNLDKTVVLSVDGEARLVHSFATTVHGVLDAHDIRVGPHTSSVPTGSRSVTARTSRSGTAARSRSPTASAGRYG
jgi:uncharacterized protein YabE (DUF348 family)